MGQYMLKKNMKNISNVDLNILSDKTEQYINGSIQHMKQLLLCFVKFGFQIL